MLVNDYYLSPTPLIFKEIAEVIGDEGVWFNTEVLIAVGEK